MARISIRIPSKKNISGATRAWQSYSCSRCFCTQELGGWQNAAHSDTNLAFAPWRTNHAWHCQDLNIPELRLASCTQIHAYGYQRWVQPGQQQGRRFPSVSPLRVLSIRRLLVSSVLADSIQHVHSLRASGVISSHASRAAGSEAKIFRKSAGNPCTTPPDIAFLIIG